MVALLYLDTSALFKRYVDEIGSVWLRDFLDSSSETAVFLTSILTAVETSSAMARCRSPFRPINAYVTWPNLKDSLLKIQHITLDDTF
jgi:hypothetical protein